MPEPPEDIVIRVGFQRVPGFAIIDLADNWLNIGRLELSVYADNARAIGLYERFGFEREGFHPAYSFRNGAYVDSISMARLRP